jgi:starch synthase
VKILFAASEVAPVSKTGGLADVAHALPKALTQLGHDVRIMTPAWRGTLEKFRALEPVAEARIDGLRFVVREGRLETGAAPLWLVDCPELFGRPGALYTGEDGREYADNARRFGLYGRLVAQLALGRAGGAPDFDVVHLNDWHTGLAAAWLQSATARPGILFTIHNLAFQGNYPAAEAAALGLPPAWMTPAGIEFHGQLSFMKAGLVHADAISTVSPTYAREILTPEFGAGLDGVLRQRAGSLHGIQNGIDEETWNPATDVHLARRYGPGEVAQGKRANRRALERRLGLARDDGSLLAVFIGRLTRQKGVDLLLEAPAGIDRPGLQLALLGTGERALEAAFKELAAKRAGRVAVTVAYDEPLAHLMEAAADAFLMPSRFEPCGLNQMYSQRYGTVPLVRRTGGLADTVTDATPAALADGSATGICFEHADAGAVGWAIGRAIELRMQPATWASLQQNGMRRDFGWATTAERYVDLYRQIRTARTVPV